MRAAEQLLSAVAAEGRSQLLEHEVYAVLEDAGGPTPPRHLFVPAGAPLDAERLADLPGDRVVVKLAAADVTHKTDVGGVVFTPRDPDPVRAACDRLQRAHPSAAGVLIVEHVDADAGGLGAELFVGIRATRELGPVIAAGVGGVATEFLARRLRPDYAVAHALATTTDGPALLTRFAETAAYELLAGRVRGGRRLVEDAALVQVFDALIALARRFAVARADGGPELVELEVNPFACRAGLLVPLDGHARLGRAARARPPRPTAGVDRLITPRHIGVLGASARGMNFGRIILNNVLDSGFPRADVVVVKAGVEALDGVRCVPAIGALDAPLDVLVIAAAAPQLPALIDEVVTSGRVAAAILVPGGVGETEGSAALMTAVRRRVDAGRARADGGPVFLGPNSMGVVSHPGGYDTFFIPHHKLPPAAGRPPQRLALISQSGAFIISRLSKLETLQPALSVSLGNQLDVTLSDMLKAVLRRADVDVVGVYAEGFDDLDGLAFAQMVSTLERAGKVVVLYQAGRSPAGQRAAQGHTAALAGDYDVCARAMAQAGALVADDFAAFGELVTLALALHDKHVHGASIAALSNAGYETVGMADTLAAPLELATLGDATRAGLSEVLAAHRLAGIVDPDNPLDITPMAPEAVYEAAVQLLLDDDGVDAAVIGVVPLTAALATTAAEIEAPGSLAERLPAVLGASSKPAVVVIDSGPLYDPLARALGAGGVPVFRSADRALLALRSYLAWRLRSGSAAAS